MNLFAKYIESLAAEIGLTDDEMAEIMGVGRVTLENYLDGYVLPAPKSVVRLGARLAPKRISEEDEIFAPLEGLPLKTVPVGEIRKELSGGDCFFVEVREGIEARKLLSGSIAAVKACSAPENGDILLVSIDGKEGAFMEYSAAERKITLENDKGRLTLGAADFGKRIKTLGRLTAAAQLFS